MLFWQLATRFTLTSPVPKYINIHLFTSSQRKIDLARLTYLLTWKINM